MSIVVLFHQAQYRNFKAFYLGYVRRHLKREFPQLVSFKRFVALMKRIGVPLFVYLHLCIGRCTGISFVDSTPLRVCHNRRIERHRVFAGWAARGKTTMGWFYGFKLHLVVNDLGEIIAVQLTPGMSMIASRCHNLSQRSLVSCLATKAIYPSHSGMSCGRRAWTSSRTPMFADGYTLPKNGC